MDPKQQRALNNCHRDILRDLDIDKQFLLGLYIENLITEAQSKDIEVSKLGKISSKSIDINLSANSTFSLWCVPLIKVLITELPLIYKNIRSVLNLHVQVYRLIWRKTHYDVTDKNNNVSSEGLDRHHHK